MWPIVRSLWFLLAGAASIVVLMLNIHLQVARIPIANLGLQPDLFNGTRVGLYDSATGTVTSIGLYVAPIVTVAGIALSIISILVLLPMFATSFGMKRTSCITMVYLELTWSLLLSLFWMAYAVVVIMGTIYAVSDSCRNDGLCLGVQVLKGMTVGIWVLITLYFLTLLTLTSIAFSRGQRRAFISSTRTSDFFTRAAPGNPNASDVAIVPRVHYTHNGNETDAESVYSMPTPGPIVRPIPVHLDMTSSRSYDAHVVSGDWHEMKPVPIESHYPRMNEKQFTLESDDGDDVTDMPIEQDDSFKYHKKDVKVKTLD